MTTTNLSPNDESSSDVFEPLLMQTLSDRYPSIADALAAISARSAQLALPMGTVHIVSDVHGEYKKLRHIINNASGTLRPLVDELFADMLPDDARVELLNLIYYPREAYDYKLSLLPDENERQVFLLGIIDAKLKILRTLAQRYSMSDVEKVLPHPYQTLFRELIFAPQLGRSDGYVQGLLAPLLDGGERGQELVLLRLLARLIRNLSVSELIVAGDLGDRGPRIDQVIDYLSRQPHTSIIFGNHDVVWLAACLGHDASIATVVRISLRYGRTAQLEEGYGIPLEPLESLARAAYSDDPAKHFAVKSRPEGPRDELLLARMQKAIAVLQFKSEGQIMQKRESYQMAHRRLLHLFDVENQQITIDGKTYPLRDVYLPTVNWQDPYALSADEQRCIERLRQSFLVSQVMWQQMNFITRVGSMYAVRDGHVIFHGCMPIDDSGAFLPMNIDGQPKTGRALFDGLQAVVQRAVRHKRAEDLDMLWYLWTGPLSPLFGKDRMATLETYFIADKAAHKENKNPYFKKIHEVDFCRRILQEFGVTAEHGLIVNGHVPVKLEQGESPLKQSGLAVTIDGAFSEAYGDKGYTLVIGSTGTYLAQHHHFSSVLESITTGADIVPTVEHIRTYDVDRTVGDTEQGTSIRREIDVLRQLIRAYERGLLRERY